MTLYLILHQSLELEFQNDLTNKLKSAWTTAKNGWKTVQCPTIISGIATLLA